MREDNIALPVQPEVFNIKSRHISRRPCRCPQIQLNGNGKGGAAHLC